MDEGQSGALAPVVPVAPVAEATPAPDATAAPVTEAPEGGEKPDAPEKMLPQSEVNRILAKERAKEARRVERAIRAEAERDLYKRQLEETRQPREPHATKGEPKREDYPSDDAFIEAVLDRRVEMKLAEREAKREQETVAQRQQREAAERASNLQRKLAEGRNEYGDDFEERVMGEVPFTEPMVRFFEESDVAHKVMHELSQNVAEAARIAKLSPVMQIRELDKLEAKLKAPPKITQTPAPIVPSGTQGKVNKDYSSMTTAEHVEAWRNRKR